MKINLSKRGFSILKEELEQSEIVELKKELTLSYNKARQAAITGEILEIVGGAEALNG